MKRLMILIMALFLVLGISSGTVLAEPSLDATADIFAVVLEAFDVTNIDDLDFGTLVAPTDTTGTVTVNADGTIATNNIPYHDGVVEAATFEITGGFSVNGDDSISYSVELPDSETITNGNGGTMTVDNFTSNLTENQGFITSTNEEFSVGATLNVGAAQEAGSYNGSFEVTVIIE